VCDCLCGCTLHVCVRVCVCILHVYVCVCLQQKSERKRQTQPFPHHAQGRQSPSTAPSLCTAFDDKSSFAACLSAHHCPPVPGYCTLVTHTQTDHPKRLERAKSSLSFHPAKPNHKAHASNSLCRARACLLQAQLSKTKENSTRRRDWSALTRSLISIDFGLPRVWLARDFWPCPRTILFPWWQPPRRL
jgi:hypothetical protein